jgi:hypothetical protein
LRVAYSAELAAANAYAGHARSVRDREERQAIRDIRADELAHRARVGEVLAELGARPGRVRERLMSALGWAIAASCFVGGWFLPMFGAGRIEKANIGQYEQRRAEQILEALHLPAQRRGREMHGGRGFLEAQAARGAHEGPQRRGRRQIIGHTGGDTASGGAPPASPARRSKPWRSSAGSHLAAFASGRVGR